MRICSAHCGAEPQSQSGGEVYERELIQSLAASGHELHLILASHKATPPGAGVIHRPYLRKGLRWWVTPFVWPWAIARCWRECGPFDLLRAHSVRYAGPSCLVARRLLRLPVPVVTHIHHLDASPLNGTIEKRVLNASDLVITDSAFARSQLITLGVEAAKIRVVNSGIADRYRPMPHVADKRQWKEKFLLLACAQMIERKDPVWALDVMRHLKARGMEGLIVLAWIGKGSMRAQVERLVGEWGLGNMVALLGHVTEGEKLRLLNSCDAFLHSSVLEGFALAPQEAMACGKPVVARPAASMEEMVEHGVSGWVADDAAKAAEAIIGWLEEPRVARMMGQAAQARAEARFRWCHTMAGVEAAYQEAVER